MLSKKAEKCVWPVLFFLLFLFEFFKMQEDDFKKIKSYFPDKDDMVIRELMTECRDIDDVIVRLGNNDESANWKKNETKNKKAESDRNSRNGTKRPQRAPRENKSTAPPPKKAKEPTGALLQKKKQPEFGPASNATWGDIKEENGEIVSTAKPVLSQPQPTQPQPAQPKERAAPVQQETATPAAQQQNQQQQTQQSSMQQNSNNRRKQANHDINPENIQQPQQTKSENQNQQNQTSTQNEKAHEKNQRPKNASLFLPVSLNNITPDLSKFGIFAGPLPQETPTRRTPELVRVSVHPTFVVPPRPKVILSNQYHHFEIQRPPSPPPQPKIQPPVSVSIETQTQLPKEEPTPEIQQQQQIPISQVNALPHVAPVQSASVGPVGSQPLFVNYAYPPFAPFPYAQFDPNATQQAQQPVAFVQYPINQGAYPIPFATLPAGYPPMPATIPQGAQQQTQPSQPQNQTQQPPQNQRQIPKNYNNNKSQYNEDQRSNYNYNNAANTRNQQYHAPIHQNRPNQQYP